MEPSEKALGIAARVWCDQDMRTVVMDSDAAIRIAMIVDEVLVLSEASKNQRHRYPDANIVQFNPVGTGQVANMLNAATEKIKAAAIQGGRYDEKSMLAFEILGFDIPGAHVEYGDDGVLSFVLPGRPLNKYVQYVVPPSCKCKSLINGHEAGCPCGEKK